FRSVSKAWKSLIDSTKFIADHHRHTHQRHNYLLVTDPVHGYVSVVDDDTFPQHKFPLNLPMSATRLQWRIGSSQGLFCFYNDYFENPAIAIWNPAIRKLVDIGQLPQVDVEMFTVTVGFGVCPHTLDPKIVIVSIPPFLMDDTGTWQVEVAIDRFIYWPALHTSGVDVIISFDLTSEEFTYIYLPDVLTSNYHDEWEIFKLKESLAVLQICYDGSDYDVWIMENVVQKSFKKVYGITFHESAVCNSVLEFRNSGEPIVILSDDYDSFEAADNLPDRNHYLHIAAIYFALSEDKDIVNIVENVTKNTDMEK
ncbi:putative F-box domain-containing protein, partial [Tanacetum coccineum]